MEAIYSTESPRQNYTELKANIQFLKPSAMYTGRVYWDTATGDLELTACLRPVTQAQRLASRSTLLK
jgi:hypothetical protein